MILVALIAVAMGGLLMVSTAPDLSSASVSLRSREFTLALGQVRRAIRSQPLYLTTTDFSTVTAAGTSEYKTGDMYDTPTLYDRISRLQYKNQAVAGVLGAGASFLTTMPTDPYTPEYSWYDPSTNPAGLFWGASYNAAKNPTFLAGSALESYVAESLTIFHLRKGTTGNIEIWRSDRFGQNLAPIVSAAGCDHHTVEPSPDGTRLAFIRTKAGAPGEANVCLSSDDGSQECPITDTKGLYHQDRAIWSNTGSHLVYLRWRPSIADSHQLVLTTALGTSTTPISTGTGWSDMTIYPTYDWSPDGRFLAYAYKRAAMATPRIAVRDMMAGTHLIVPDGSAGPPVSDTCPLAFSPSSNDLLYAIPGETELYVWTNLKTWPVLSLQTQVGPVAQGPYHWADWVWSGVRPAPNVTGRWVVFAGGPDPLGSHLYRKALDVDANAFKVSRGGVLDPKTVRMSASGAFLTYRGVAGTPTISMDCVDGSRGGPVIHLPEDITPAPSPFGATRDFWALTPANTQIASSANRNNFDANAWRALTNREADFDGDSRFGSAYLRVLPPGRQRHFLFDDATNSYMVEDQVVDRGQSRSILKTFIGKVTPTWSPRGLTFVARKSMSAAGEPPQECFKEAIDVSATTVLVTTGYDPALSPDDKWVAVSRANGELTTDAPSRVGSPLLDMDLWIANSSGAPEPVPVHLTPDTKTSQERAPAWSPDGRYIYYQRETQESNSFLGNHNSTIFRITADGGANTEIVGNSQVSPYWNRSALYHSRVECYSPAVSPDGCRLAFIGRERILESVGTFTAGDIIGEMVFVKDLVNNREPVALIRSSHSSVPVDNKPPGPEAENNCGFDSLSWAPSGEEIYAVRFRPINTKFPQYNWDTHTRDKVNRDYWPTSTEVIRVVPKDPSVSEKGTAGRTVGAGLIDPPNDNYQLIFNDLQLVGLGAGGRVFSAKVSSGAYAFQRISSDRPIVQGQGVSLDVWYALSAYVRTSGSSSHFHQGQVVMQLFNGRGLLISQVKNSLVFQSGMTDVGGPQWNRYSAAVKFDSGILGAEDLPPYSVNLCLYSFCSEVGSVVEVAGLKLERAFDQNEPYPTAFGPDWTVFSTSKDPDPVRPGYFLYER